VSENTGDIEARLRADGIRFREECQDLDFEGARARLLNRIADEIPDEEIFGPEARAE
jgi:hypothetical protein